MHCSLKECTLPAALHAFITHLLSVGDPLWVTPGIRIFESNRKELYGPVGTQTNTFLVNDNILWKETSLNLFKVSHFWTKADIFFKRWEDKEKHRVSEVKTYFYRASVPCSTSGFQHMLLWHFQPGKIPRCRSTALCFQQHKIPWDSIEKTQ